MRLYSVPLVCILSLSSLLFSFHPNCIAQEIDPKSIIKAQDDLLRGDTLKGRYKMTVTTPNWTRTLELDVWSQGRDKTFIRITAPAKEAGITTLRDGTNMWNYLPNVERMVKIPPSMMLQPWMGSDFANDDLVKESSIVNDYEHRLLGEDVAGGQSVYRIELTPKPSAAVTWGKIIFLVRKDNVPLREEFYSENGNLIKVLDYTQVKTMSDRDIPTRWTMSPQNKKGYSTVIEILESQYNQPLEVNLFTLENLKRSP